MQLLISPHPIHFFPMNGKERQASSLAAGNLTEAIVRTEAISIFGEYNRRDASLLEARCSMVGLYFVVAAYPKGAIQPVNVEVFFPEHRGFVFLDEGDMPSWLAADCFRTHHIVYGLTEGGWLGSIDPRDTCLHIASATCKEWLVVTAKECVSIFSLAPPRVREISV